MEKNIDINEKLTRGITIKARNLCWHGVDHQDELMQRELDMGKLNRIRLFCERHGIYSLLLR